MCRTGQRNWDHPRVCGEKTHSSQTACFLSGSPPRMRGKEWYLQGESPAPGITPAYAGKRRCPRFRPGKIRDHPRVCGEKVSSTSPIKCLKGSPPRVRGKGQAACEIVVELGITPAYAGKRSYGCGTEQCGRDHPRVCGEKSKPKPGKDRRMESPPRVRGKGVRLPPLHVPAGITPAYAGKSYSGSFSFFTPSDHPRVCGEKCSSKLLVKELSGSPPRMRGKDGVNDSAQAVTGITPACAGKSCSSSVSSSQRMSWTIRSRI